MGMVFYFPEHRLWQQCVVGLFKPTRRPDPWRESQMLQETLRSCAPSSATVSPGLTRPQTVAAISLDEDYVIHLGFVLLLLVSS